MILPYLNSEIEDKTQYLHPKYIPARVNVVDIASALNNRIKILSADEYSGGKNSSKITFRHYTNANSGDANAK